VTEQGENRDSGGRFRKGQSGNLRGRPRKAEPETPREILREIATNKRNPAYARAQAAKALSQLESEYEQEHEWTKSVQVRPDWSPPTWEDVISDCLKDGSISVAELVSWVAAEGMLAELRAAVEAS
jgi:Family of unknown function (DUF5681)